MTFRVLSIDGGGMRGIIPAQILVRLEEKIKVASQNPKAKLGDYFDLVTGTSTGAILGATYITPNDSGGLRYGATDALDLYLDHGAEIFERSALRLLTTLGGMLAARYSSQPLRRILRNHFGDVQLSGLAKPCCFIAYDIERRCPRIFKQHTVAYAKKDYHVYDVLTASSAAPTYFKPARIVGTHENAIPETFIDGGLVSNDPALVAYSEAIKFPNIRGIKDMLIFSLGTGVQHETYTHKDVKGFGPLRWTHPILNIALDGGPQMTEYHLRAIDDTSTGTNVFRLQPKLYNAEHAMDDVSAENLAALVDAGNRNADRYNAMLDQIVARIIVSD